MEMTMANLPGEPDDDLVKNTQTAPYPDALDKIVTACTYRPGWMMWLSDDEDRGQGCEGLTLIVLVVGPNSYPPHEEIRVRHLFPVPPAAYGHDSWQRWLFEQLLLVERHECMEFFTVDGHKPYAPNHGHGEDPYIVHDLTTDETRRTDWRNIVRPA
jgi:hypothetical protein